jgi:hypothetical protein
VGRGSRRLKDRTSHPVSNRKHHVKVSLNDQEIARLDEIHGDEERAGYLRRLLHEPPSDNEVATHTEAMAILSRLARDGRTTAAIALERALRDDAGAERPEGELERLLCGD